MALPTFALRTKITLLLCGVILVLGLVAVVEARKDMRRTLGRGLDGRGQAIARDLAANATDSMLTGDLVGLYELVNRTKLNNSDVRYIVIVTRDGELRANTFGAGLPRGLLEANMLPPGSTMQLRRLQTEEGIIRDVAVPIMAGRAGTTRVGLSDHSMEAAIAENTRYLMAFVAAAVVVGLAFSYWLGYYLTRPLRLLVAAVESVTRGDLSHRIESPSRDEVGQLGHAFNIMAHELEAKETARQELMAQILGAQEEERARVSRELHDGIGQALTALSLGLETLETAEPAQAPAAQERIQRLNKLATDTLSDLRRLTIALRPAALDELGLVAAINRCAELYLGAAGIDLRVEAQGLERRLDPSVETVVYRIVQEAMNNVARHSQATRATVSLRATGRKVVATVEDNGTGFDPTSPVLRRSPGLQGMQERASLAGGKLTIASRPGQGTAVRLEIPLVEKT